MEYHECFATVLNPLTQRTCFSQVADACGVCGGDGSSCAPGPAPAPAGDYQFVAPSVEELETSEFGATFRCVVALKGGATNAYSAAGTEVSPMSFPPAFQAPAPFGANMGGTNEAFWPFSPAAKYDSWLTVGITAGDTTGALSSIGIDFAGWTADAALETSDGAIFFMEPDTGPAAGGDAIVVAQLTVPPGTAWTANAFLQGRNAEGAADWRERNVAWSYSP